ncbi:MAG: hypothetical protein IAE80_14330 [Anaerolinea sp.]|nr:hypothetical protein [Anaerolinea sp.]
MSYTPSMEDTQPRSPFQDKPLKPTIKPEGDAPAPGGTGCGMIGLIGVVLLVFGVLIVVLAGAAGWTTGQREAQTLIASTRQASVQEQVQRIPGDVANGNTVLLRTRLEWLATTAPDYADLPNLVLTGTAVYLNTLPTAAVTPSPTEPAVQPTVVTPEATSEVVVTPAATDSGSQYDVASLFEQAQTAMNSAQWEDAYELLDVVIAVDPTYQTANVRRMINQALQNRALELYNAGQPAAANILVGRAEEFGQIDSSLDYERYAAELYLTARAAVGIGSPTAIAALERVMSLGFGGRYYEEAQQLLYNQYVIMGDAYYAQTNYCSAANQYQLAMGIFSSGTANGKYSNAQNLCQNAVPTVDPNWALTPGAIAPVGVVTTPGF